ncbi:hypothetical protein LMJ53_11210 [Rheinheimera sp. UJ51]|uniref:hypothetical protein n=1 Tax=Rheinheimera sp. UJ51 TaxID=2892446 RepID=UPI001E425C7E|nr:hypothetical protein [Rheinheimera sp. UJ51]MCC5452290.1 hypothetical protein [Rheinheimera sp. UJ51]
MFSLFSLLLSSTAPTLDHLTLSERSLLQTAIHTQTSYNVIAEQYAQCQQIKDYQILGLPEKRELTSIIEATLNIPYKDFLFAINHAKAWQSLKPREPMPLVDCSKTMVYQDYLDQYALQRFALEIAEPITKPLLTTPVNSQQQESSALLQSYAQRSSTIAIVTVTDRQTLTAIEQANYLHLDYTSRFIYRITQGWKNVPPLYMGMHIQINEADLNKFDGNWLIFLDAQKQYIAARPVEDVEDFIKSLGKTEWQVDSNGNLQRP